MGEPLFERPNSSEVFPSEYVFEAADRLKRLEWGKLLYPTVLHTVYQKYRIHTDVIDPVSGEIYHLSSHRSFFDLPKNTPEYLIPGYGSHSGGLPSPLVSLTNRSTQTPTHLLLPNFESGYRWQFGPGLRHAIWSDDGAREGTFEEQKEFKTLFERLAPLE